MKGNDIDGIKMKTKVIVSKLKTLKDIEMMKGKERLEICEIADIHATARAWITWWKYCINTVGFTDEIVACYESQIRVFKHFFNLEE